MAVARDVVVVYDIMEQLHKSRWLVLMKYDGVDGTRLVTLVASFVVAKRLN